MVYEENDGVTCGTIWVNGAMVAGSDSDNPMDVWRMGVMAVSMGIWRRMEMTMPDGVTHVVEVDDRGNGITTETSGIHVKPRSKYWAYGDSFPWSVVDITIP